MTRRPLIIDNICASISTMAESPPTEVCPAAGKHPETQHECFPPRTRRRKSPLGRLLPELFELPTLSNLQRGVAPRRKRGGLNEIDSGVPQVSGAASHRLSLSGRSADRRAGRRSPSTFYRDICRRRKVRKTNRKKKIQLLLLPGPFLSLSELH